MNNNNNNLLLLLLVAVVLVVVEEEEEVGLQTLYRTSDNPDNPLEYVTKSSLDGDARLFSRTDKAHLTYFLFFQSQTGQYYTLQIFGFQNRICIAYLY